MAPATRVLQGRFRNSWADRFQSRLVYSLIKEIRANLMLGWLRALAPQMKTVFVMRHPCAVVTSQLRQGWRMQVADLLGQEQLVEDYLRPFSALIRGATDDFDRNLVLWCIENYVPLEQFQKDEVLLMFYEEMVRQPEAEVQRLFSFLGREVDPAVFDAVRRPSALATRLNAVSRGDDLLDWWRAEVSPSRMRRALEILREFGLDRVYGEDSRPCPTMSCEQRARVYWTRQATVP